MECRRCEYLSEGEFPGSLMCHRTGVQMGYNRIDKSRPCEAKQRTTPLVVNNQVLFKPEDWDGEINEPKPTKKPVISCSICGAGFETGEEYREHMNTHAFYCEICGARLQTKRSLTNHLIRCKAKQEKIREEEGNMKEKQKQSFACPYCGKEFAKKRSCSAHQSKCPKRPKTKNTPKNKISNNKPAEIMETTTNLHKDDYISAEAIAANLHTDGFSLEEVASVLQNKEHKGFARVGRIAKSLLGHSDREKAVAEPREAAEARHAIFQKAIELSGNCNDCGHKDVCKDFGLIDDKYFVCRNWFPESILRRTS